MKKFVIAPDKVVLFGLSYCSYCKGTQKYLSRRLIDFIYVEADTLKDADRTEIMGKVLALNPEQSFPTIVFGDTGLVQAGYDTIKLHEHLEVMLAKYPQIQKLAEEPENHGPLAMLKQQVHRAKKQV
jgi:glutaredoxin